MQIRAMVIDDSAIMRKMVMKNLTASGLADFMYTEASDGQDALDKFPAGDFDVLFVDWNMPNMSGIELVRAVRAQEKKTHVAIVMVTSESTMDRIEEALDDAGADSYICKPFTPEVVCKKLAPLSKALVCLKRKEVVFLLNWHRSWIRGLRTARKGLRKGVSCDYCKR